MNLRLATLPLLLSAAVVAHAQTAEIEVNDGTSGTCYRAGAPAPCDFFDQPTIDTFVADGAGQSSEINTTAASTWIETSNGTSLSRLNIIGEAAALESDDAAIGRGIVGTQVGTSSITGLPSGQFIASGENTANQDSTIVLEGTTGFMRTRDTDAGTLAFYETSTTGTMMGYAEGGAPVSTITSDATGHHILGDTALDGTLSVTGASTLKGIDNQGAGITNAGLVTGVAAGNVSSDSTEAVNGSQLFGTEQRVATAQTTADTAITNAATAQTTADTALANAATAQTTADSVAADAATAHSVAVAASETAASAQTTAVTAQTTANTAIGNSAQALTAANSANSTAMTAYGMASALSGRVSDLETNVRKLNDDIEHVDQMAGRGIAIATALASIPDLEPGKTAGLGLGVGSYDGRNAVSAAFVVRANENLKLRVNGGTAGDGKFAFGAGGMLSW